MRYRSLTIRHYRAVAGPLTIDLTKRTLLPIIGINESGKTTILHAICAFDHYNDALNGGRHLEDTQNLLTTSRHSATISADIETSPDEIRDLLSDTASLPAPTAALMQTLRRKRSLPDRVTISRNLDTRAYKIHTAPFDTMTLPQAIPERFLSYLPYVLYFDDFRDKIPERIVIGTSLDDDPTGWLAILEQLFQATDPSFSVLDLPKLEERQRKSVLAKVLRTLNGTLTREWQHFRLDDRDALKLHMELRRESVTPKAAAPDKPTPPPVEQNYLALDIVERDAGGDDHYFHISDRSKGFFWFFNFVMKVEFNPKVTAGGDGHSVYLLDEPGSYLHAAAQAKLCSKLKSLSERNCVLYCTHSHYLLDPSVIPLSSIHIADKDGNGRVALRPMHEHRAGITRRGAFQPVFDALQARPFGMDLAHPMVVIVEGIFDYYCMELFRGQVAVGIVPSVGAQSVKYFVSLMIGWGILFRALWDNDDAGRAAHQDAEHTFGEELSSRLHLLPSPNGKKRVIEDLVEREDLTMYRNELGLPANTSFEKVIAAVFYSTERPALVAATSARTTENFRELFAALDLGATR